MTHNARPIIVYPRSPSNSISHSFNPAIREYPREEEKVSLANPKQNSEQLHCLIVHDNIVEHLLVEFLFKKLGFTVLRSNNILEASVIVSNTHPDMIIVGLDMQHSCGMETCRSIFSWFHHGECGIPCPYLVALSTQPVTPELSQNCAKLGFHQLIGSPLTLNKIEEEVVPLFEKYANNLVLRNQ